MASGKKRRKAARQARKQRLPQTGPFRHPDGDRRHRDAMREVIAKQRAMQKLGDIILPEGPGQESGKQ